MSFLGKLFSKNNSIGKNIEQNDLEQRYQEILQKLKKYKEKAYLPLTKIVEPRHSAYSKIGGLPYLGSNEDWPVCPNCNRHMQLFLQLNLETLPTTKSEGLVQLFYCTSSEPLCEVDLEAFFPFSKAVCCRRIKTNGNSFALSPNIESLFEEKIIVGWEEQDDYPDFEEYDQIGLDFEVEDDVYELMYEREEGLALGGDKLFGWPHWVQSVEYPKDRNTGEKMKLLFQLDSECNLPYMFGDAGIGHITVSPDNPHEMAFGWACT